MKGLVYRGVGRPREPRDSEAPRGCQQGEAGSALGSEGLMEETVLLEPEGGKPGQWSSWGALSADYSAAPEQGENWNKYPCPLFSLFPTSYPRFPQLNPVRSQRQESLGNGVLRT